MKTKHFYHILFALLLLSFVGKAQSGIYLYYPGITEKAGPEGHADEVSILAVSYGFSNPGTVGSKTNFQDYSFTKYNDISTSGFQNNLFFQTATDGVELRVYQTGVTLPIQVHKLSGVKISSYSGGGAGSEVNNSTCANCTGLTENITMSFTRIAIGAFAPKM